MRWSIEQPRICGYSIVLTTLAGSGASLRRTYGYSGSEQGLLARGLISTELLDPLKARILLRYVTLVAYATKLVSGCIPPFIDLCLNRCLTSR